MTNRGWYYTADKDTFAGIYFLEEGGEPRTPNDSGPFRTFGLAKRDALSYYRADIEIAREQIQRIKATKKEKP